MNIKTNLLEDYVNFVDITRKQKTYFEIIRFLFAIITSLFCSFFSYLNELYFFFRANSKNRRSQR